MDPFVDQLKGVCAAHPTRSGALVRAQSICLPPYLSGDEELSERVSYAWAGLSRACHQHPYELPPVSDELLGRIATVEELVARKH